MKVWIADYTEIIENGSKHCHIEIRPPYNKWAGGELKVKIPTDRDVEHYVIDVCMDSSDAIMVLLLHVDAIYNINPDATIDLDIKYLAYAREDRICKEGESFGLRLICGLFKQCGFNTITLYNPHSVVAEKLIDHNSNTMAIVVKQHELTPNLGTEWMAVAPDKGAWDKVAEDNKYTHKLCLSKVRDETGKPYIKPIDIKLNGAPCIILDDICDGGRTFIEAAKVLKEAGAGKLALYTTYGIYSNGIEGLLDIFDVIYYNWQINNNYEHERLKVV